MSFILGLLAAALLSGLITGALRRYAVSRRLLDVPNARSSHRVATPRGGGLAIAAVFLAAVALLAASGQLPWPAAAGLLGAGAGVAGVGLADDRRDLAARWRLLAHFVAAGWALCWLGGVPPVAWPGELWPPLHGIGLALGILYLAWMTNLYNFMDGIDGIAAVEAIGVCLGGALLGVLAGHPALATAPLYLAAAVAGFVRWNFPAARIFMGDAGSGFLGMTLGILSVQAGWAEPRLFWGWIILLGAFVADATVTLARRGARGARLHQAHRSHAYQQAARRLGDHRPVTLAVAAINLLWLLPIAVAVTLGAVGSLAGLAMAYLPLVALAVGLGAGRQDDAR